MRDLAPSANVGVAVLGNVAPLAIVTGPALQDAAPTLPAARVARTDLFGLIGSSQLSADGDIANLIHPTDHRVEFRWTQPANPVHEEPEPRPIVPVRMDEMSQADDADAKTLQPNARAGSEKLIAAPVAEEAPSQPSPERTAAAPVRKSGLMPVLVIAFGVAALTVVMLEQKGRKKRPLS